MSFATALSTLTETASVDRVGERPVARLADVRSLVSRELAETEKLIGELLARGIEPAGSAAAHLFESGGKRVRPLALMLAAACFGRIDARTRDLAAASELVHMATLLHDDVIDDGDLRRSRPTSRKVWGNAVSVLAGDLLLVESLRLCASARGTSEGATGDDETWRELVATLGRLVDGEVIQLRGRSGVSLDESTYFAIIQGKTASLFEWALRAGARTGGAKAAEIDALGRFGAHIGVAFQLVDDVLDYDGEAATTGKALLADLAEGKVTLPLLRAAKLTREDFPALVARVREGDAEAATRLATLVRSSGACAEVRDLARKETSSALAELEIIPACRERDVLADVAHGLAARLA